MTLSGSLFHCMCPVLEQDSMVTDAFYTLCCGFRALEESQQVEVERALVLTNQRSVKWHQELAQKFTRGQVVSEDLSQNVVAVCGVILPKMVLRQQAEQVCDPPHRNSHAPPFRVCFYLCWPLLSGEAEPPGAGGVNLPESEKAGSGRGVPKACAPGGSDWLWENCSGGANGSRHRTYQRFRHSQGPAWGSNWQQGGRHDAPSQPFPVSRGSRVSHYTVHFQYMFTCSAFCCSRLVFFSLSVVFCKKRNATITAQHPGIKEAATVVLVCRCCWECTDALMYRGSLCGSQEP